MASMRSATVSSPLPAAGGGRWRALKCTGRIRSRDGRVRADRRASVAGLVDPAEAPGPLLEVPDRLVEVLAVEVRPENRREVQLRVRGLPQQEVAEALLAAGADDQVGVGHVGVVQAAADRLGPQLLPLQPAGVVVREELLHGVRDLDTAAVIERDRERHAGVALRELLGDLHLLED